eukprot:5694625-Amphidinium_carterae.1
MTHHVKHPLPHTFGAKTRLSSCSPVPNLRNLTWTANNARVWQMANVRHHPVTSKFFILPQNLRARQPSTPKHRSLRAYPCQVTPVSRLNHAMLQASHGV